MSTQEYISSGILELYVMGALPVAEAQDVSKFLLEQPEALKEVEGIEVNLRALASAVSPIEAKELYAAVLARIESEEGVITLSRKRTTEQPKSKTPVIALILSWAAVAALLVGSYVLFDQNKSLENEVVNLQNERTILEGEVDVLSQEAREAQQLVTALRSKDVKRIPLGGQKVAPEAYAAVFWNEKENKAYIDVSGLPKPPSGKVYQVWSLKLDPLTPTSLGTLDNYVASTDTTIFEVENTNDSEAFGITLEPEGGSPSPNLEQLYALGAVSP